MPFSLRVIPRCGRVDKQLWYYQMDRRQNYPKYMIPVWKFSLFKHLKGFRCAMPFCAFNGFRMFTCLVCVWKGSNKVRNCEVGSWFSNWKDILFNYLRQSDVVKEITAIGSASKTHFGWPLISYLTTTQYIIMCNISYHSSFLGTACENRFGSSESSSSESHMMLIYELRRKECRSSLFKVDSSRIS